MAKSIEEQIANRCVHFTGIGNPSCKKGIRYDSFGKVFFQVIPCMRGGSGHCELQQFPTADEVRAEVERDKKALIPVLNLYAAVKEHYENTKQAAGKIMCPNGDHIAVYTRAETNGHFWVRCKTCGISLNE